MNPKTKKEKLEFSMASIRSSSSNSRSYNNSRYNTSFIRNDLAPDCLCHMKAVIRTVNKEGPNKGKKFWGCRNFVVSLWVSKYMFMLSYVYGFTNFGVVETLC
jgi:hypothetical protein